MDINTKLYGVTEMKAKDMNARIDDGAEDDEEIKMDIKQRIDGLTEAEAKAALFDTVSRLGFLLFQLRYSWASDSFGESAEDCANQVLDDVLKKVQKC